MTSRFRCGRLANELLLFNNDCCILGRAKLLRASIPRRWSVKKKMDKETDKKTAQRSPVE